jgi:hypothetical protein
LFWLLTPLDRIRRDLGERGIPLAMSTLVSFERAADLLAGASCMRLCAACFVLRASCFGATRVLQVGWSNHSV